MIGIHNVAMHSSFEYIFILITSLHCCVEQQDTLPRSPYTRVASNMKIKRSLNECRLSNLFKYQSLNNVDYL